MSELTDAQVVEILARREGWTEIKWSYQYGGLMGRLPKGSLVAVFALPPYLGSRDALAPVLAKLSDEEWLKLTTKFYFSSGWRMCEYEAPPPMEDAFGRYLLTLPPATLARALAAVIQAQSQPEEAA